MEYILAMYIAAASSIGIPGTPNSALSFDSETQCKAAVTAWEASSPQAEATCTALPAGRYGIELYVYGTDRASSGISLRTFPGGTACSNAKTAFEASDGSASYARAACLVVPIGGRND